MTIIEEIENEYDCKIKFVKNIKSGHVNEISKKDLEIINGHKFTIKSCIEKVMVRCKICRAEADFYFDIEMIHCFYDNKNNPVEYASCTKIIMERACI